MVWNIIPEVCPGGPSTFKLFLISNNAAKKSSKISDQIALMTSNKRTRTAFTKHFPEEKDVIKNGFVTGSPLGRCAGFHVHQQLDLPCPSILWMKYGNNESDLHFWKFQILQTCRACETNVDFDWNSS